ncbi:MAG TPA: SEC-C metal-binding domain-containing protein [Candidatus Gastranaerophilaceae bacterium]|nr:SEC-C metal-binding domain-containing protein [Candidatus Gastranaerophilaceae bacterium]HPT41128.1 SEC-C metal-binding domain-containing protein [Candidatus Gastranaerophilaceae bacterium]
MSVIEKFSDISDVMSGLIDFVQTDDEVKADFTEYLSTVGVKTLSENQLQSVCLPYIFERNLGSDSKSIIELFLEKTKKITKGARLILKALTGSIYSVFEVKKILKNGFEFYNLVNEKDYSVISLVKMTHFRGVGVGQYVVARIFEFEGEYYLLEISNVLAANQKEDAMRFAIAKIIQSPEIVYKDNPKKQKEIEVQVKKLHKAFLECFGKEEIVTTNKLADDIIGLFNDFAEGAKKPLAEEIKSKIKTVDEHKFFHVQEFNNSYENFLENSLGGFSAHKETYDVGVIFDEELGLSAIPFYQTFCKIFEEKDYKTIENYEKCVEHFLLTDSVSANLLRRVEAKYKNFMKVINKIYSTEMTFDELLEKYKKQHLTEKIFSSTTVLYESKIFAKTLGYIEEEEQKPKIEAQNVGRNEPCPCGSGKKYKKCCLYAHA